jgi:hypothetical protein
LNTEASRHVVFVLVGSSGKGINNLVQRISERPKGKDLMDRIPTPNRFEIPAALEEDRLVVFVKQALLAARAKIQDLSAVERLALYYVLSRPDLASPRQCAEAAKAAVGRMDARDARLRYDHLFRPGDQELMEFYATHITAAQSLRGTFTDVGD